MEKNNIVIGLDLSLTHTGVVVLDKGKILYKGLVKSKPEGDKPLDELNRIMWIAGEVEIIVEEYNPEIAVIENLAFMAKGTSLTQLAGLSYFVRAMLADRDIPFYLVAPTSLKKFITGSGKGEKDAMMMSVLQRYGEAISENNMCDAYALSKIGELIVKPDKKIPEFQKEVLSLLEKQCPKK